MRDAFFLDGAAGRIFCVGSLRAEATGLRGRMLIIGPFAEEMNKSRHLLSSLVRSADAAGFEVLMPDLYGTGDSEGDFGDATLDIWRGDLDAALARTHAELPLVVVGLRAGALLATDLAGRHTVSCLTLLHPQTDGRQQLTQILRLRIAGGMRPGGEKETTAQLRQRFAAGEVLEIAGYRVSGALAAGLESLMIADLPLGAVEQINWIEVAPDADRPLMSGNQHVIDHWTALGKTVNTAVVACDEFWGTQEISQCRAMIDQVMTMLSG
jgi:exosortase A-associated hydrolase 2